MVVCGGSTSCGTCQLNGANHSFLGVQQLQTFVAQFANLYCLAQTQVRYVYHQSFGDDKLMARETVPSVLRDVPYDKFDARIITEAAQKGDSLALEVFRCTAERLGRALANAVAITSPEAVFFFGGLAQAGELLLEPTRRYLEENLLPVYRGNVKVLPSGIPAQNAAILGASALIWNE